MPRGVALFNPDALSRKLLDKGLTPHYFAELCFGRRASSDMSKYLSGKTKPTRAKLELMARVLECEIAELLLASNSGLSILDPDAIQDKDNLRKLLSSIEYEFSTTSAIRELISDASNAPRLLNWATELAIELWDDTDLARSGILATMTSTSIEMWSPRKALRDKLSQLTAQATNEDDVGRVGIIEPLVFSLTSQQETAAHRLYLNAALSSESWRAADRDRITNYYGSPLATASAVIRHLRDKRRSGLLRANDVARLIDLNARCVGFANAEAARRRLNRLFSETVKELHAFGDHSLAKTAECEYHKAVA